MVDEKPWMRRLWLWFLHTRGLNESTLTNEDKAYTYYQFQLFQGQALYSQAAWDEFEARMTKEMEACGF